MSAGAPWSVKGIDPKAREIAKDLARREGLTLGDWLNQRILEETGASAAAITAAAPRATPEAPPIAAQEFDRLREALDRLTLRIESAEHRSTLAISGIDQTVLGLLSRLESAERDHVAVAAHFEGALEELRAGQAKADDRIAKVEEAAAQPRSVEALRALEAALGKVAAHLYDSETRTRETLTEMREDLTGLKTRVERLDEADLGPSQVMIDGVVSRIVQRLEEAEARTSGAIRGLETSFTDFDRRLTAAETRDDGPERRMEQLAAELTRNFEATRDELAERLEATRGELTERFSTNREDLAETFEAAAEARFAALVGKLEESSEARFSAVERSLRDVAGQLQVSEQRSTRAMERMGHEVLKVADAMGKRMEGVETRAAAAIQQVGGDVARIADVMEGRLRKADQVQAESLERLGTEIARITERLAERIANAERRSAQAIDDVGEQVGRITERLNQRQERASADLVERIRQSEERTARLLDEAREKIDQRLVVSEKRLVEQVAAQPAPAPAPPLPPAPADPATLFAEPDLPPGPFSKEAFGALYARRGGGPAGFVPPVESLPEEAETSPFESDDFDAAQMFEDFAAEETAEPDVDEAEAAAELIEDADTADGDHPRATTRDLIAQARAAARASQEGDNGGPKKSLFSGFGMGKKEKKGSKLKSGVMIAASAAALGVSTAGLTLYSAQWVNTPRPRPDGDGVKILPGRPGGLTAPNAAVALAPQPAITAPVEAGTDLAGLYADATRRIEAKDATGVTILRRAANLGYAPAQFDLAKLYEAGEAGVPKNIAEARRWTERAAENGDRKAMHNLALYYFEGTGGPKSQTMAAQWFRRAAELGLVDSQFNLAKLHESGLGVSKNDAEAYKWYLIASRTGDLESRSAADRIKKQLSGEARTASERAAAAFRPETAPAVPAQAAAPAQPVSPDVVLAQKALSRLGYYKGPSDGVSSPALKLAIIAYQRDQGLSQTGAIDPVLTSRLSKAG